MRVRIARLALAAAATLCVARTASAQPCDAGAVGAVGVSASASPPRCYYGFSDLVTWQEAETACEGIGGYLAVIDGADENTLARAASPLSDGPWIGFNDINTEADTDPFGFVNVFGGPLVFDGFDSPGEPSGPQFGDEDCVHFLRGFSLWNDHWCDEPGAFLQNGYICEVEGSGTPMPTPTPGQCAGDCDGSQSVSIGELSRTARILVETAELATCPSADSDADDRVTVDELMVVVNHQLNGCEGPAGGSPRTSNASISVDSATAMPGRALSIAVRLDTAGETIAATQNDIGVPAGLAIPSNSRGAPDCADTPGIDKPDTTFGFLPAGCTPGASCTSVRALVTAFDNVDPIPPGSILYTCRVQVAGDAQPGALVLGNSRALASDPSGTRLVVEATSGAIRIEGTPSPTPQPGATPGLTLSDGSGVPGGVVPISVRLHTGSMQIAGMENVIELPAAVLAVDRLPNQRPNCTVNPTIDKEGNFAYLPTACSPGNTCMRAIILSLSSVDPIPDDSEVYSCQIRIADDAPVGRYTMSITDPSGSDPEGSPVSMVGGIGTIEVVAPEACVGDCSANGRVAIAELIVGVNIALGTAELTSCPPFDASGSGRVDIGELITAVNNALEGCPERGQAMEVGEKFPR